MKPLLCLIQLISLIIDYLLQFHIREIRLGLDVRSHKRIRHHFLIVYGCSAELSMMRVAVGADYRAIYCSNLFMQVLFEVVMVVSVFHFASLKLDGLS